MENKKNFGKSCDRGFTLIELLVVITIIGILSSMVLVSLGGARAKARDAKRESDITQIALAMELDYHLDDERYSQCSEMPNRIPSKTPPCVEAGGKVEEGRYLDPVPHDPKGGKYHWIDNRPGAGTGCDEESYCIYADLEEGGYFAGCEKGTRKLDAAPTKCPCW